MYMKSLQSILVTFCALTFPYVCISQRDITNKEKHYAEQK
jgi:hypothetical protein